MHLKGESDLGALPKLRLDSHFAPVRLDEAPDQRQSQASPLVLRWADMSACTKGRNICSISSLLMPIPVSSTSIFKHFPNFRAETVTLP
eukprot:CAMPEP_0172077428 /NCGR_PEP_ID=MMETSP1043-20130122/17054_1 /TAXON_ID=464988 /ORGANISM="Hemiselmis andersenii, Strain CCMP441" /LENGTH=88 /DNA_ID=CAMNT_0012738383 /DNA_START=377 /DNA_END=641 /DNA_ORIENTATION=+